MKRFIEMDKFQVIGGCKEMIFASTLIFLFLISTILVAAPNTISNDSLKKKYPLEDPRNPNCPCHSFQKEAEIEFRKMKLVQVSRTAQKTFAMQKKSSIIKIVSDFVSKSTLSVFERSKQKKNRHSKRIKNSFLKGFFHKKITDCPTW